MALTSKASRGPKIYFERPQVTGRLYAAKGPSGWIETFDRKPLDEALTAFLGVIPVVDAIDAFIMQREISDRPTTWQTVVGFIGRLLDVSPLNVPPEVGLAFWGQVELVLQTRGTN